ncbi:MAG: thiolase family protein [Dehalococcoidales bacterium]|nr:thiolase family protein [Dehalococcoidales bacterium]
MAERDVVFIDGMRTPFGRMGGTMREMFSSQMGSLALKGLVEKTKIAEKGKVDCVFAGTATGCSRTGNPARWVTLAAGLPKETSASYIEMQCGSAIDAINHAAWKIKANHADVIIAGGMESYSQMFAKFSMSVTPYKLIPPSAIPGMLSPVREDNMSMGMTAENLQVMYNIPREASDEFAYQSQMRTKMAQDNNYFKDEIVPVLIKGDKKNPDTYFTKDEHPRGDTTMEALAKLPPAFKPGGTVTAGNSSGQNDGGAFVLMMSAEKAKQLGYTPMARWISGGDYGVDPKIMGIGPAYAIPLAMKRAGLKLSQFDHMECNEAFAVQNLAVIAELEKQTGEKVDRKKWNPLGGAIAYGHPNGASGARVCMFTMRQLARTGGRYGFFSSCCGGGLGVATVIENLMK